MTNMILDSCYLLPATRFREHKLREHKLRGHKLRRYRNDRKRSLLSGFPLTREWQKARPQCYL